MPILNPEEARPVFLSPIFLQGLYQGPAEEQD